MKKYVLEYIDKSESRAARGLRISAEYFYALDRLAPVKSNGVHLVSVFGSARIKEDAPAYRDARRLGTLLYDNGFGVVTGGSHGIMEAANAGVADGIAVELKKKYRHLTTEQIQKSAVFKQKLKNYSVGLCISLPFEQEPNPYLGVEATFHYFMIRKFFFATLSSAFIACEGGWGTRDEFYEILTLVQTGKAPILPIVYVTDHPQHIKEDCAYAMKRGFISKDDLSLLNIVPSYKKAVEVVKKFYTTVQSLSYDKPPHVQVFLKKPLTKQQQNTVSRMVSKQYADLFAGGVKFYNDRFELRDYRRRSYGVIRKIIDAL